DFSYFACLAKIEHIDTHIVEVLFATNFTYDVKNKNERNNMLEENEHKLPQTLGDTQHIILWFYTNNYYNYDLTDNTSMKYMLCFTLNFSLGMMQELKKIQYQEFEHMGLSFVFSFFYDC
ncbi:hypothetical protein ACJX0J_037217, partial [Zea mays]